MNHRIGAHLSTAGGYTNAINRLQEIGGNCLQIFAHSPRMWPSRAFDLQQAHMFREKAKTKGIKPVYFHASYLLNLADPAEIGIKSVQTLINELRLSVEMDVHGSVVHTGSFKNSLAHDTIRTQPQYSILLNNIRKILNDTPEQSMIILENAGTRKIGKNLVDLAYIMEDVASDRIRICLDTCHLHAAGYDLRTRAEFEHFIDLVQSLYGWERVELLHINDSKDPFCSLRDRHENIGQGQVDKNVFISLLSHPLTSSKPMILETPGFDNNGPDAQNIEILESLV